MTPTGSIPGTGYGPQSTAILPKCDLKESASRADIWFHSPLDIFSAVKRSVPFKLAQMYLHNFASSSGVRDSCEDRLNVGTGSVQ